MAAPGVTNRKRLLILLLGFTLAFLGLTVRLGYIQLVWGKELQAKAVTQWTRNLDVYPERGKIKDRNGVILAQSGSSDSIAARPSQIKDPEKVAAQLAPILELDYQTLYQKLSDTSNSFVWIKRQVSRDVANQVRALNIKGIDFTEEPKRYYPNGNLASHILGFTMKYAEAEEGLKGQEGVELYYDKYLKGYPGKIVMETDARGREMPDNVDRYIPPIDGLNLVLTIDSVIQHFTEKAVADAMDKYNAKKVYAIVMDPNTGEILAMANKPDFDPNNPPRELGYEKMQEYIKNFAAKDSLDPGSTFKIITAASALDSGVVSLNSSFDCPGYRIVDGQRIKCWKAGGHGHQNFAEAVQNSCNPAFMDMALRMGTEKFYSYIYDFGFGQKTGVDIYGEAQGILISQQLVKTVDLARIGFGQSISVTPLQLITAASAAINGGNLMRPYIAKAFTETYIDETTGEEKEKVIKSFTPQKVRQVISPEVSKIMREVLQSVVEKGSGSNAYIPGYRVAGKTGTAQKYGEDGKIMQNKHIASFLGFAPADDPKVIVFFAVDEPEVAVDFGSVVAAPYVKQILEDTLPYLGVEPVFDEETIEQSRTVIVPDVIGKPLEEAVKDMKEAGLQYLAEQTGTIVKDQMPKPGAEVIINTTVLLYMENEATQEEQADVQSLESQEGKILVPSVIGKSIREANNILVSSGLRMRLEGSGIAISQDPPSGSYVDPDTEVVVKFGIPDEN